MRPFLLAILRCPSCRGMLTSHAFVRSPDTEQVVDGVLLCGCGASYPVVNTIPRMLADASQLFPAFVDRYRADLSHWVRVGERTQANASVDRQLERTRESFGYQWTVFSEMSCDFQENFWNYLKPATPELLQGTVGLDVGCGFGRHLTQAARYCSTIVGVDLSRAIDSAYRNTRHLSNVHLVQADLYALPFAQASFDFVYSIGVLHHLPDPTLGLKQLTCLLRPHGRSFIWLYSKKRRVVNFMLECVRRVTTKLPHPVVRHLAFVSALVDQGAFVSPYRRLRQLPHTRKWVERLTPARIRMYSGYPFQVLHADWFDRLAAPLRHYYDEEDVWRLMRQAGFSEIQVSATGLYGWRACGMRGAEGGRTDGRAVS